MERIGEKDKNKFIFYAGLFLINIVFAIDMVVDWGIFSGFLYLTVLPLAIFSTDPKKSLLFAWLASVYMVFEVVVLSYEGEFVENLTNHSLAFIVLWVVVITIENFYKRKDYYGT